MSVSAGEDTNQRNKECHAQGRLNIRVRLAAAVLAHHSWIHNCTACGGVDLDRYSLIAREIACGRSQITPGIRVDGVGVSRHLPGSQCNGLRSDLFTCDVRTQSKAGSLMDCHSAT